MAYRDELAEALGGLAEGLPAGMDYRMKRGLYQAQMEQAKRKTDEWAMRQNLYKRYQQGGIPGTYFTGEKIANLPGWMPPEKRALTEAQTDWYRTRGTAEKPLTGTDLVNVAKILEHTDPGVLETGQPWQIGTALGGLPGMAAGAGMRLAGIKGKETAGELSPGKKLLRERALGRLAPPPLTPRQPAGAAGLADAADEELADFYDKAEAKNDQGVMRLVLDEFKRRKNA